MKRVLSVSDVTHHIRFLLESDPVLADVWIQGEVSNWSQATSGHCYFTLKDSGAQIRCVMWRRVAHRLLVLPQDGDEVVARGHVTVYPQRGDYQFYVEEIEPLGQGVLYRRFEALKARLQAEGLFDPARKQPLPLFPRRIGIVTSPKAAALRDILNVLRRRHPLVEVILSPTLVQGSEAPQQIVAALEAFQHVEVDLVIVARGGGSLEELWAFNEEVVARAIARCHVPVISGVGHEVDFTIADFVADQRAPTPSAAAELAVPDRARLLAEVQDKRARLKRAMEIYLAERSHSLAQERRLLERLTPLSAVERAREQVVYLRGQLARCVEDHIQRRLYTLNELRGRLQALNPHATLRRGYAAVAQARTGRLVRSPADVRPGDPLRVTVAEGAFAAVVGLEPGVVPAWKDQGGDRRGEQEL